MSLTPVFKKSRKNTLQRNNLVLGNASSCISRCAECTVSRAGLCGYLDLNDFIKISADTDIKSLPAIRQVPNSDRHGEFAILINGYVRVSHQRADGHRQVINLVCPGELIELSQQTEYFEIESATDVQICNFQSGDISELLVESHRFRRVVLAARHRAADRLRNHVWALGALRPAERIVLFMINSCGTMPWQALPCGGGILTMQLARADIAAYLGTTVETLCRVIGKLDSAGMIRATDPRHFEIPDLGSLARYGRVAHYVDKKL